MKIANLVSALLICASFGRAFSAQSSADATHLFIAQHCAECHDPDMQKGNLDLSKLDLAKLDDANNFSMWVKVYDRVREGEMPPPKKPRPEAAAAHAFLESLGESLTKADLTRQKRDGRAQLRRLNRVELENSLQDLLFLPGLKIKDSLPADGKSHGFDRLAGALDMSYVHMELYLAAVDKALNDALCPLPEKPPVFKYRYSPWIPTMHEGKECEGSIGLAIQSKTAIGMVGMKRDETFLAESHVRIRDDEPKATAVGMFRHEDADYRCDMNTIHPVLSGWHHLRVSGYSFGWDGKEVVPTERHGALGWGIFSKGEHYGTVDLPPNKPAERVITAWLERGGGMTHGTDDNLRIIAASCENFRDYANGKNKDVLGPMSPAPGVAIEWVEIEGPINDQWPPASHQALFGDLPVKEWTASSGVPKPAQQIWPNGNPSGFPKDIYGERGAKRPIVFVESKDFHKDAERLLRAFIPRAFRRAATAAEIALYKAQAIKRLEGGAGFQDAMISAYRAVLTSPEFLLQHESAGKLNDFEIASRLSYFLWNSTPDEQLLTLAGKHELNRPAVLHEQTERLLNDPKAARFIEDFLGQWLALREIGATQPDKKIYPEYMPWLQEAMLKESRAFFADLIKNDLPVTNLVKSDFVTINEPLAHLYKIDGVRGWDIQRVALPANSPRGGFLTQASVLKTTANGTTTSPVKRGAFVMDKLLGIVPTPPPPDISAIEPDVRGTTTIRQQLDKHRNNATCAGCHQKMDGYGFALESFDVVGEWRDKYRALGGAGPEQDRKRVNGRFVEYHASLPVDCTGVMPDGRQFKDVNDLRTMLAAEPERLATAFAKQLVTYATDGEMTFADRARIQAIVQKIKAKNYGLRSIIHEVIQSELFQNK